MQTSFSTLCDALNYVSEYEELKRVNNVRGLSTLPKTYKSIIAGSNRAVNKLPNDLRESFKKLAIDYEKAVNYE